MKTLLPTLLAASLLTACGPAQKTGESPQTAVTTANSGSVTTTKRGACRSVAAAGQLGKPLVYHESAKPITVSLTLNQDAGTVSAAGGCYYNNTITVLATRTSGRQLFKRTMLKDDLLYFVDTDDTIKASVLQSVTYKPTFNGEQYFNLTMQLLEPVSRKTTSYLLFMNYHGEIVKVKKAA